MLTIAVLGTIEARQDGVRLDVPAGKTTELLARLALDGSSVRAETLLEDLWSAPTGRNTLQSKVSQLRRALGDPASVEGSEDGYRLMVDTTAVDAACAIALAGRAAHARRAGDPELCLELAGEGLALFRGEVLPDAGAWATGHRARLEELHLELVEDAMAARVELGAGGEVVAELEALVARHPLREGLWESLITALYRAGRQADALAAYGRVRRLLVEELGIDPGSGLRALEREVLQQSPSLEAGPLSRAVAVPGNLTAPMSPLVGRSEDLTEVASALVEHGLVTVVGVARSGQDAAGGRGRPAAGGTGWGLAGAPGRGGRLGRPGAGGRRDAARPGRGAGAA